MAGRILIRLRPTFKASWIAGLCLSACASWPGADQVPALKGFPVAAAQGGEGPWHLQRVEEMETDRVVIAERVESDGRRPQLYRLTLDSKGQVVVREALPTSHWDQPPNLEAILPLPWRGPRWAVESSLHEGSHVVSLIDRQDIDAGKIVLAVVPRAEDVVIRGLRFGPGHPPLIAALEWVSAGEGYRLEGVLVLDLRAGRADLMERRGLVVHRQHRYTASAALFRLALDENPEDASAAYNLACALARLGQTERALTYLGLAVDLDRLRLSVVAARDPDLDPLRELSAFRRLFDP